MHVLVIDDDRRLGQMLASWLQDHGVTVGTRLDARSGLEALSHPPAEGWDAVVLDVMLPDLDGFEVLRRVRALPRPTGGVPILMLTARGEETDRVVGLELGADDYLPKPFSPRELLARLRAITRRSQAQGSEGQVLRFGDLEIDPPARQVRLAGEDRPLTSHQFDILVALARAAGRVLNRDQIMDAVRGEPLEAFDRSIDVHISRIRAAIGDDARNPRRIVTVRGVGYVFTRDRT